MTKRTLAAGLLVALLAVLAPAWSNPAGAAGMTTHAWMAISAVDRVDTPALKALLRANLAQVRSGARFPDGGYGPGNVYGEEAHWQRFTDIYADIIRTKASCGDLTRPTGPCAAEIAHLMGVVAHGTGDEVWDWLFEPYSPDLDEYYLPEELSAFQDGGGQELVMDLVAIGIHDAPGGPPPALPNVGDLLTAFQQAGQQGVTADQLGFGQTYIDIVYAAESSWVPDHLGGVLAAMPWMANNMVTAPGGVEYAAEAIAGQWEDMWARLTGADPTTEVSITYPAPGQRRIPAGGWARDHLPGSAPGRGGARTRVAASLTYAVPYHRPGGPGVPDTLPVGAMTLTERDTSVPVATAAGYPRVVPYGADAGIHTIDVQPAADLAPCTWYRADVTSALLDADGQPVTPFSWEFRTGTDAAGSRCADDPYTPDELWVRQSYRDVLGREADAGGLASWAAARERGLTPGRFATSLVGSAESRSRLAAALYTDLLGRAPDSAGRAFWADQLRTVSLPTVRARFLATAEVLARAGGTPASFVRHVYPLTLGRAASSADVTYWSGRLSAGMSRGHLARSLLQSVEAQRRVVRGVYQSLLHRTAGPAEVDYWVSVVRRSDERAMVRFVVASPEYRTRAQTA